MKIKTIRTVTVSLTASEVEQAVVDSLPKRFTGQTFIVRINEDGTADLELEEIPK